MMEGLSFYLFEGFQSPRIPPLEPMIPTAVWPFPVRCRIPPPVSILVCPTGNDSAAILPGRALNNRRVRWLSASSSQ